MKNPNDNVKVEVSIKVIQGDGFYEARTIAEATSSEKGNVEPDQIAALVAEHTHRAHKLVEDRVTEAAREITAQRRREAQERAEREARPDLA